MGILEEEIKKITKQLSQDIVLKVSKQLYNNLNSKIELLTNKIVELNKNNTDLKDKILELNKNNTELNAELVDLNTELINVKKKYIYNEKDDLEKDGDSISIRKRTFEQVENSVSIKKKKRKIYLAWEERMANLLKLKCLTWKGENVIEISRAAVEEMFPAENNGRSLFQFQRIYGKKGDQSRFDISYDKIKVRMKHRCLKKESILRLYNNNETSTYSEEKNYLNDFDIISNETSTQSEDNSNECFNISQKSLENLLNE